MKLNTIIQGDCLEVMKDIPHNSVDLVCIDPPYNVYKDNHTSFSRAMVKTMNELRNNNLVSGFDFFAVMKDLVRLQPKLNLYIWSNKWGLPSIFKYIENNSVLYEILLWEKTNPVPVYHQNYINDKEYCIHIREKGAFHNPQCIVDAKTIYQRPINSKDKKIWKHPTIKPVEMIRTQIRNSSKEGDTVLDCFLGSGTTAVACIIEGRNFIGIEQDEKYCKIARQRIKKALGGDLFGNL